MSIVRAGLIAHPAAARANTFPSRLAARFASAAPTSWARRASASCRRELGFEPIDIALADRRLGRQSDRPAPRGERGRLSRERADDRHLEHVADHARAIVERCSAMQTARVRTALSSADQAGDAAAISASLGAYAAPVVAAYITVASEALAHLCQSDSPPTRIEDQQTAQRVDLGLANSIPSS